MLDPARKSFTSIPSIEEFAEGQAGAMKNMAEHLGPGEIASPNDLGPEEGGILRQGLHKVAVSKDAEGRVIRRSAVYSHGLRRALESVREMLGCPCHGSQFAPDGAVLNGPAVSPLAKA